MNRSAASLAGFLLLACSGCTAESTPQAGPFPSTLVLDTGETLRLGDPLPGGAPGAVLAFEGLHLPDGTHRVFAEADSLGHAFLFEFWYVPGTQYPDVVAFHEQRLGAPTRRFERLVGECTVWEEGAWSFEVCKSREPGEHGEVIAHVLPKR